MRFYLNMRLRGTLIDDPDGEEFASLAEAREEAVQSAREIMAEALKSGRPLGGWTFEISDEAGNVMLTLPFEEALPQAREHTLV